MRVRPKITDNNIFFRLAVDQSEINKIIADVSKGSKFYEVGIKSL